MLDAQRAGRISAAVRITPELRTRRILVLCARPDLIPSEERRLLIDAMTAAENEAARKAEAAG